MKLFGVVDNSETLKKAKNASERTIKNLNAKALTEEFNFSKLIEEHEKEMNQMQEKYKIERAAIFNEQTSRLNELASLEGQNQVTVEKLQPLLKGVEEASDVLSRERASLKTSVKKVEKTLNDAKAVYRDADKAREKAKELLVSVMSVVEAGTDISKRADTELGMIQNILKQANEQVAELHDLHAEMEGRFTEQETEINRQMIWIIDQKNDLVKRETKVALDRQKLRAARELTRKQYGDTRR